MIGGSPRSVRGLSCLATLCAAATVALGQAPGETAQAEVQAESGTLVADNRTSDLPRQSDNEREYIAQPPAIARPSACHAELQAHIRLSGTVYDARHPDRSLAILGVASSPATAVYRTGSRFGHLELLEVRTHAVLLSSETDSPCWLKMARPNPNAPPPAPAAAPAEPPADAKRARRKAFSGEELEKGIQRIGPGVYRVERSMLDRALARAPKLARTTRTKTVKHHGAPVGLSLTRIESGGLFEHLGLKRGDVLRTVNGFDVASVDGMLSARTQLGSAPRLSLALMREGQPMTLEYRVQ
jgi:type II secretory pathway component PulC